MPKDVSKQCYNDGEYAAGCASNAMSGGIALCEFAETPNAFTLYLSGLSKDACSAPAAADWGSADSIKDILANGVTTGDEDATHADSAVCQEIFQGLIPLANLQASKVAAISEMCPCTSGKNNCVSGFIFRLISGESYAILSTKKTRPNRNAFFIRANFCLFVRSVFCLLCSCSGFFCGNTSQIFCTFGGNISVNQFNNRHRSAVTISEACFNNAGVTTVA